MPSKSRRKTSSTARTRSPKSKAYHHPLFWPLLGIAFILWMIYRTGLQLPVWFDETFGKAIFFGLPVWLYMSLEEHDVVYPSIRPEKLKPGLLLGVAIGGLYGFAAALSSFVLRGGVVQAAAVYAASAFWWEFFLAVMTSFWETLFFYSWVMGVVEDKYRAWSVAARVGLVAAVFLLFHLPNTYLVMNGDLGLVFGQAALLTAFALGQALVFWRWRNFYTLVLSQAFWGMALLIHVS